MIFGVSQYMSGCPVDIENIYRRMAQASNFLADFNRMTELPWTPYYAQDGNSAVTTADADTNPVGYWALAATISFTVLVYVFENYLNQRQQQAYKKTEFPKELEVTVTKIDTELEKKEKASVHEPKKETDEKKEEKKEDGDKDKPDRNAPLLPQLRSKFVKSQDYGMDKISFSMFSEFYNLIESIGFLILGFLPYIWDYSKSLGDNPYYKVEGEIGISLIFLLVTTVVGTVTALPFELYSTFKIEKRHGFNKMTLGLFFSDKIKGLILTFVIGGPFMALFLKVIEWGGDKFYIYVWALTVVFSLFMMTLAPVFIMPLFNKYEPLPEGELKTRIYALADQLKYPLTKLFVMDGSKRSSHSNAFMFGFGKNKRIVLFDTLMDQVTDGEILAILGHELGHWKLGHTLSNLVITQAYSGVMFYVFSLIFSNVELFSAFGFSSEERVPTIIALLLFSQTVWAPVDKCLSFAMTLFSRYNEFGADEFSLNLGMSTDLQSGLCKIHLENLGAMCPDNLYSTYHYSHPPLVERLGRMMELDMKGGKKLN